MNPCSASLPNSSRGNPPATAQSRMFGRISASANARAACWTSRFSSVSAKSTMGASYAADRARRRPRTMLRTLYARPMEIAPNLTPVLGRYYLREWSHGEGHRLFDTDGRAYLDFANGIAVTA